MFFHIFVALLGFLGFVQSHTFLLEPTARKQNLCIPSNEKSNCCAQKPATASATYTRGQVIKTSWGRNNHIAGFIRYAIVPIAQSDTAGVFDNDANVFQYNCYAPQCVGRQNEFFTGDPEGTPFNGIKCSMNVRIPDWLPDGTYTFQWRWHGGGDSFGIKNLGLVDFVSCHDFNINGGQQNPQPQCPLFIGGDASKPDTNSCEFFKSNDIATSCKQGEPNKPNNDCFGWYAQAPPKTILSCPSNILPGGMNAALNGTFAAGQPLPLIISETKNTVPIPPGTQVVNLDAIRAQQVSPLSSDPPPA